jgi:glc operon protein GlcG
MNHASPETRKEWPLRCAFLAIIVVPAGWYDAKIFAQEASIARAGKTGSDVMDGAAMFSTGAIAAAQKELARLERETNVAAVIQTVESLRGKPKAEAAAHFARESGIEGLFVLIAKKETQIEVLASRKYRDILTRPRQDAILAGFVDGGLKRRDFDAGLKNGVSAIGTNFSEVVHKGERPEPNVPLTRNLIAEWIPTPADSLPLVVRNQVRLGLAGARAIIAGCQAKAAAMQVKVNIAVVDEGGHLLAFERMDGARPASGYTAITKATTAATFRQATGPLPAGTTQPDPLLNLSLQNAAQASGGKITTLFGGVPVVVDDQFIGGVGIGGGTGEQDAQVARAGVQALLDEVSKSAQSAKDAKTNAKVE